MITIIDNKEQQIDSSQLKAEVMASNKKVEIASQTNYFMWLTLVEFIVILYLLVRLNKSNKRDLSEKERLKRKAKEGEIDFSNTLDSAFNAQKIYKELKRACHPDRFPKEQFPEKNAIADKLSQEIGENKYNIKRLQELKEEAIKDLEVNL